MSRSSDNVIFLGVVRFSKPQTSVVVAARSHSASGDYDKSNIKMVLDQPNFNISNGRHYNFFVQSYAWHLFSDKFGLIYVLVCQATYPHRCAQLCLEEFQRSFTTKFGEKGVSASEGSLTNPAGNMLLKICQKYDDVNGIDKLANVTNKVESVKLVMQENIQATLANLEKLENIEKKTEDLQAQASVFKNSATDLKNKMWWKNIKMKLIIAIVILAILGIIIGIIVGMSKKGK
eukprot:gene8946-12063_t